MAADGTGRRDARERTLHLLYEAAQRNVGAAVILDEQVVAVDDYAVSVVTGVDAERIELDAIIESLSEGWALDRMPTMDRLIVELGLYELIHRTDVPTAVVLNEATELANTYSTDDSGRFVNGLLAAAARDLRGDAAGGKS
jgi:N utilization substance protein B